jgi:hypothetical protein
MTSGDNEGGICTEFNEKRGFLPCNNKRWASKMASTMKPALRDIGVDKPMKQAIFRGHENPAFAEHYDQVGKIFLEAYFKVSGEKEFLKSHAPAKALYDALGGEPVFSESSKEWATQMASAMKPELRDIGVDVPMCQTIFRGRKRKAYAEHYDQVGKIFLEAYFKVSRKKGFLKAHAPAKALYIRLGGKQTSNKTTTKKRGNVSVAAVAPAD